ncbi:MAG: Nif3-like dinuclear metal center hexameric protein, partial [Bdellovibrionia bacterium]
MQSERWESVNRIEERRSVAVERVCLLGSARSGFGCWSTTMDLKKDLKAQASDSSKVHPSGEWTVEGIVRELHRRAPAGTAESWDNVGLLVGDPSWTTRGAVVSIDLTSEALELAQTHGFRLIITHHPCLFPQSKGPNRVVAGSLVFQAISQGVAVVACHTNFDQCALEVLEKVAGGLGVEPRGRLFDGSQAQLLKLVTFVPKT